MNNNHINYIEFKGTDLKAIEEFYTAVFDWKFTWYGEGYIAFENSGVLGGFMKTDQPIVNGVLVVLYHQQIETVLAKVKAHGGVVTQDIFSFPGGKRFQFTDPSGNELAVWSE